MKKRLASAAVLLALGMQSGCASWCARNYPCQPVGYAPAAPCYCAPPAAVPACQPNSAYSPTWQAPAGTCPPCAPR